MSLTMQSGFTTTFDVDATPAAVFDAVTNVRGWWTGAPGDDAYVTGDSAKVGDVFVYRYADVHRSVQRITESVPEERVVWHVDEAALNFIDDPAEWVGTDIVFDIAPLPSGHTELRFTHVGLLPAVECYDACSNAWASYVGGSLKKLIESR
ncbi:hypothetical protein BH11ACT3_BH11ACT3_26990 [soil metagenome]